MTDEGTAALVADRHVVIVTTSGTFTVNGRSLTKQPVDSVDKLEKLIGWALSRGGLQAVPRGGAGYEAATPGRVWVVGDAWRNLVGAGGRIDQSGSGAVDPTALGELVGQALAALVTRGWELRSRRPCSFVLARTLQGERTEVEVLVEPRPWIGGGSEPVCDDPVELGRRVSRWAALFGVLPEAGGRESAAVLAEQIRDTRIRTRVGAVALGAGFVPDDADLDLRIQPDWVASQSSVEQEVDRAFTNTNAVDLVWLQQRCPLLPSAGMATVGYGEPKTVTGDRAAQLAVAEDRPFGLWYATLPPLKDLNLPALMPPPHPSMRWDSEAQALLVTEDLDWLSKEIRAGGAGLAVEKLRIGQAVVWPEQGRLMEAWYKPFRDAIKALSDDPQLQQLVESAAEEFLYSLGDQQYWDEEGLPHWGQVAWLATFMSKARFRGRTAAMRISREEHVWPLFARGAGMVYALPRTEKGEARDISDAHTRLGRMEVIRRVDLTDDTVLATALAQTPQDLAGALTEPLDLEGAHVAAIALVADDPASAADDGEPVDVPSAGAGGDIPSTVDAQASGAQELDEPAAVDDDAEARSGDGLAIDEGEPVEPGANRAAAARRRTKKARQGITGPQFPAAVLHTDGLWLPDGTRVDVADTVLHAGHVAELAYTHNIRYALSAKYFEQGQIWLTEQACLKFGIDVEALGRKKDEELRELTKDVEFVTAATADGWLFGGKKDEGDPSLGSWTRVYHSASEQPGVWIALIPGMVRGSREKDKQLEMPVLAGAPSPAQIAGRLKLFADALGFPWKVSAGTTAIDLMIQARPQNMDPVAWRTEMFAPSTTPAPTGVTDVNCDFNWSRTPTAEERAMRYLHAFDRGGSYPAVLPGLQLGIGDPERRTENVTFDAKLPGYWLTVIPEVADTRMPYILNPGRRRAFEHPKWVCTPAIEQAIKQGYDPEILEAIVWPSHSKVLEHFYKRVKHAADVLDNGDRDEKAARDLTKVMRNQGMGMLASVTYMKDQYGFKPEWWFSIISKANFNIIHNIVAIGNSTGCWPLAVVKDTVIYASNERDPAKAWPGAPEKYGRGFGQYKHEASGLMAEHAHYLTGDGYAGKERLTSAEKWDVAA